MGYYLDRYNEKNGEEEAPVDRAQSPWDVAQRQISSRFLPPSAARTNPTINEPPQAAPSQAGHPWARVMDSVSGYVKTSVDPSLRSSRGADVAGPLYGSDGTQQDQYEGAYQTSGVGAAGYQSPRRVGLPPGPVSRDVEGAPGVMRVGNSYSGQGTGVDAPSSGPGPLGDLAAAYDRSNQARADQDYQEQRNRNYAGNRAVQSSFDRANAEQAARVSAFRATNGADVILAPENSGYDAQRREIMKQADKDQKIAEGYGADQKAAEGAITGTRDYLNEYVKSQEELNRARLAATGAAGAQGTAEQQKMAIEQQKRIAKVSDSLLNAKTPAEQRKYQDQLLSLLGKDKPGDFEVIKMGGSQSVDPKTFQPVKTADRAFLLNKSTNELIEIGGGPPAEKGGRRPESLEAFLKEAKADPKNSGVSIKDLTDYYNSEYGQ